MNEQDFFKSNSDLRFKGQFYETFVCVALLAQEPIEKRDVRKQAQANTAYDVPTAKQTFYDHLNKFILRRLFVDEPPDFSTIVLTPRGRELLDVCIEMERRRAGRRQTIATSSKENPFR